MSTPTTTIRVSVDTRNRLATQARERGVSISSLLADLAAQADRKKIFEAERAAEQAEAGSAVDEYLDWDSTAGDGLA